jgi:predicted nucleic-acid-binding protein
MKALDTNVLVRFLMGDDKSQSKKVYQLFKKTEKNKEEFYISILVFLEVVWVIESVYLVKRENLLESLSDLMQMPILNFEFYESIQFFISDALNNNYDLSDLLIAHCSDKHGASPVLTFDKKASKHQLFELI